MALTASKILQIKLKAEQMWADSQLAQEYTVYADAAVAVLRNQTARLEQLTDKNRENTVAVTWMDPCGTEVDDCDGSCDITGDAPNTDSEEYEMDICKQSTFSIPLEALRTNTYTEEELTSRKMMLAIKALDEYWAKQVLIKAKAFAGQNVNPNGFVYENGTTNIPASQYNEQLYAYLLQTAILNKMPSSYIIDNGSLFLPFTNAAANGGNAEGKGNAYMAAQISGKLTYDMWNFIPAGLSEDTFVIGSGAMAMKTKARYTSVPVYADGKINQWRFTVKSKALPGVEYDVISQLSCVSNPATGEQEDVQSYKVITRGGIFLNPKGCPITIGGNTFEPTGILSFSKNAPIVQA